MSGNPGGNPHRCRDCGGLAGTDGYCKNHRPRGFVEDEEDYHFARSAFVPTESGYREGRIGVKLPGPFPDKFGVIQDKFEQETRGGDFDEPSLFEAKQKAALASTQRRYRNEPGNRRERRRY